jgi:hypothetical protein
MSSLFNTKILDHERLFGYDRAMVRCEVPGLLSRLGEIASEVTGLVADFDPVMLAGEAEQRLVAAAGTESMSEFRDRCLREKVAGYADPDEHHRSLHASGSLRTRTGADGAFHLSWRATPEAGASFMSALGPFTEALFHASQAAGRREPSEALAADALLAMAQSTLERPKVDGPTPASESPGEPPSACDADEHADPPPANPPGTAAKPSAPNGRPTKGQPTKILVRVDLPALRRGRALDGEICEISGYGPIPVSVLRTMLPDAAVALVFTKGQDVVNVTHFGRRSTAHQLTALEWMQPRCAVIGCPRRAHLQIDHRIDWSYTKHTTLTELDRFCPDHHRLKTNEGWQLVAGTGRRAMVPPPPPHPSVRHAGPSRPTTGHDRRRIRMTVPPRPIAP